MIYYLRCILVAQFLFFFSNVFAQQFADKLPAYNYSGYSSHISTGDVNGDGHTDVLIASSTAHDIISLYLNDGMGNYYDFNKLIDLDWPDARLVDMDGDGDLDILASSYFEDKVGWYTNHGNANFMPLQYHSIRNNVNNPQELTHVDVDGDGDQDVLFHYGWPSEIYIAYNNGSGGFSGVTISDVGYMRHMSVGDIDGDNDLDILSTYDTKLEWLENTGDGFGPLTVVSTDIDDIHDTHILMSDLMDYDGDGDDDVFFGAITYQYGSLVSSELGFFESLGNGTFSDKVVLATNILNNGEITHADVDNDGDLDLLTSTHQSGRIYWFENIYCGKFEQRFISTSVDRFNTIVPADVNNDGSIDIITNGSESTLALYTRQTDVYNETIITQNGETELPFSLHHADIDADGDLDLVSTSLNDHKIAWYENQGDKTFSYQRIISTQTFEPNAIASADFDGDGKMDIAVSSDSTNNIVWYKQQNDFNFSGPLTVFGNSEEPTSLSTADLNLDGRPDLLSSSYEDNKIAWNENMGDGTFGNQRVISINSDGPQVVLGANLDDDSYPDVLYASINDHTVAWFHNNGNETFSIANIISSTDSLVTWVDVMDVELDGDLDVISCSLSGKISCYKNDGTGNFSTAETMNTLGDHGMISLYDLDLDGYKDILATNIFGNSIVWLRNNGSGTFSEPIDVSTDITTPSHVIAIDANHDGDLDVVTSAFGDNEIFISENLLNSKSQQEIIACNNFPSPDGTTTYTSSGVYLDTIPNLNGGNNLITTRLKIAGKDTINLQEKICFQDTFYIGSTPYDQTGFYSQLLTNQCGLDSLVNLDLIVSGTDSIVMNDTICFGDCYKVGNTYYSQSGSFIDTLTSQCGLDSIIYSNLVVREVNTVNLSESICEGDSFQINNQTFTTSGNHVIQLESVYGCDSIINLDLTVTSINSAVSADGMTLSAHQNNTYSYQWLDCNDNFSPIMGATSAVFNPSEDGSYAVLITSNGCEEQSNCENVEAMSVSEIQPVPISIFPNPTKNIVNVQLNQVAEQVTIVITDLVGKNCGSVSAQHANAIEVSLESLQDGVYLINCEVNSNQTMVKRIIKQ